MKSMEEYISEFKNRLEQIEDAPKGLAYLRFLGTELGYLKTSDLKHVTQYIKLCAETFKSKSMNVSV